MPCAYIYTIPYADLICSNSVGGIYICMDDLMNQFIKHMPLRPTADIINNEYIEITFAAIMILKHSCVIA